MKRELIVKTVQRYGILHLPSLKYVETGFNTLYDAEASCQVHQSVSGKPNEFCVVPTTPVTLKGTKEQIESWLERGIEMATAPQIKENLRPKCPVFTFTKWGYMKGSDGVTHDAVWFTESALKGKGTNLLNRLCGTKFKPQKQSIELKFASFLKENPLATMSQKRMYIRRIAGVSNRGAYQLLKRLTN